MNIKHLYTCTALTAFVGMTLAPISPAALAQDAPAQLDCVVAENRDECIAQGLIESEAPAAEEAPAPAEEAPAPAAEEAPTLAEEAPAPAAEEAPAPAEEAPAPAAEEAPAPAEGTPAPAAEEEPAPAEEAPAPPADENPAVEEAPAPAEEAPAPAVDGTPPPEPEAPVEEAPAPAEKSPAQSDGTPPANPEEPTPAVEEAPAPAEEAPAQADGTPPPAPEAPPAPEEQEPAPVDPSQQSEAPAPGTPPTVESVEQSVEQGNQATVLPDEITDEQRAEIRAAEERRRDDARDRRLELLGAAAVGVAIGAIVPQLGGKVVGDEGDRIIVERDGEYFVRKDESSLLRRGDAEVNIERLRGGFTRETITRRNGVRIVTVRDPGGYVVRRSRIQTDGNEFVLIDNTEADQNYVNYDDRLPPIRVDIPRDRYIVGARGASRDTLFETFDAPPVEAVEQAYTLREVRENERLREKVRRVDLDSVTFDSGSATVSASQVPQLADLAYAANTLIEQDPDTIMLVEGHTDAVGDDVYNLALSDRRAETVASILVDRFGVPAENLVVQGYGEQYLKVNTQGDERANRRVTMRNISPLLSAQR